MTYTIQCNTENTKRSINPSKITRSDIHKVIKANPGSFLTSEDNFDSDFFNNSNSVSVSDTSSKLSKLTYEKMVEHKKIFTGLVSAFIGVGLFLFFMTQLLAKKKQNIAAAIFGYLSLASYLSTVCMWGFFFTNLWLIIAFTGVSGLLCLCITIAMYKGSFAFYGLGIIGLLISGASMLICLNAKLSKKVFEAFAYINVIIFFLWELALFVLMLIKGHQNPKSAGSQIQAGGIDIMEKLEEVKA